MINDKKPDLSNYKLGEINARGAYVLALNVVRHVVSEDFHVDKEMSLKMIKYKHKQRVLFLTRGKLVKAVLDVMEYDFAKFLKAALIKENKLYHEALAVYQRKCLIKNPV